MIIYQVLPRLWANGKFADFDKAALEYIHSLSADAVWYTGVIRHSSGRPYVKGNIGSPYSIEDYHDVNPYLAQDPNTRMEEFSSLIERTHEAGLKVIIDYVPNHVSPHCEDVPVLDYFDYDWADTRKIDYSKSDTWEAMLEIALYWAAKGVDGLRCDMVELVPRDFLKYLIQRVKADYPNFLFIGEAYNKANYACFINELGFDLLYDKSGFYDISRAIICAGSSAQGLTRNWQELGPLQGNMLNFLENHDEQRLCSAHFAQSASKAYAALSFGALFNDASTLIYAGQELAESASSSDNGRTSIFDMVTVPALTHLSTYLSSGKGLSRNEIQVLSHYRKTLSYARRFKGYSNWDLCYHQSGENGFNSMRHFAFVRYCSKHAYLVLCNFSGELASVCINIPNELSSKFSKSVPSQISIKAKAWDSEVLKLF